MTSNVGPVRSVTGQASWCVPSQTPVSGAWPSIIESPSSTEKGWPPEQTKPTTTDRAPSGIGKATPGNRSVGPNPDTASLKSAVADGSGDIETVATILDKAGLSATEIADYLGHENPSMTQDVYMNTIKGSKRAAEVMEQRLSGLF
ncbi:hypothetical protein ACX3O0_11240 [Homoserinimonas sp. A447]